MIQVESLHWRPMTRVCPHLGKGSSLTLGPTTLNPVQSGLDLVPHRLLTHWFRFMSCFDMDSLMPLTNEKNMPGHPHPLPICQVICHFMQQLDQLPILNSYTCPGEQDGPPENLKCRRQVGLRACRG